VIVALSPMSLPCLPPPRGQKKSNDFGDLLSYVLPVPPFLYRERENRGKVKFML
jgi:hypothetical protein